MMMNVMYASDNNFAEVMAVSIKSLIDTQTADLRIFIVDNGISEQNKKAIVSLKDEKTTIVFIEQPNIKELLGLDLVTLRWGYSAFSRLFLKEILVDYADVKRILYLDCDTLIVDALDELWNTDLDGYLGAACLECISNLHKKIIDASPEDNYVNTGVLLIDVERWISENVSDIIVEFIKKHKGKIECVDQGVINGTISNRFLIVSPRYNLTALAYDFDYSEMQIFRKPEFGYSENEWSEALNSPAVIHFNKSFLSIRPWYEGSRHPYTKEWVKIKKWTGWRAESLRNISLKRKFILLFINLLPRKLMIYIAGFLHAYIKPLVFLFFSR